MGKNEKKSSDSQAQISQTSKTFSKNFNCTFEIIYPRKKKNNLSHRALSRRAMREQTYRPQYEGSTHEGVTKALG